MSDLDIYNWPEDHVRLRRAVTKTQKSLQKISDTSFLRRLERCTDAHLQRGCLNCPLASKFVGIAAKPKGIKRKGTPHAEQPRASPSPAETGVVGGRRGSSGGRGGRGSSGGRGGRGSCDGRGGRGSCDGRDGHGGSVGQGGRGGYVDRGESGSSGERGGLGSLGEWGECGGSGGQGVHGGLGGRGNFKVRQVCFLCAGTTF